MMSDGYIGAERRFEQRRKIADRREMIRFELDKEDRRSARDRRKIVNDIWDKRSL